MTDHPITPPPELVQQWRRSGPADAAANNAYERHIATQAARWGADQELEACWREPVADPIARALLAQPEQDSVIPVKQHIFPTPSQAAECGGPCYEGNYCPKACDCGLYQRSALAEQPVMPTDEELLHVAAISIEPYESSGIATGEYEPETECAVEVYGSELIAYARAVLARWPPPPPRIGATR